MHWVVFLQSAVGVVFLFAAVTKITTRASLRPFLTAVGMSGFPLRVTAVTVPPVEALCGLALIAGTGWWSAAVASVLSCGFVTVLIAARRAGVTIGCRCFGPMDADNLSPVSITRAIVLMLASFLLLAADLSGSFGTGRLGSEYVTVMAAVLGAVGGVGFVASASLLGEIWTFEQRRAEIAAMQRRVNAAVPQEAR